MRIFVQLTIAILWSAALGYYIFCELYLFPWITRPIPVEVNNHPYLYAEARNLLVFIRAGTYFGLGFILCSDVLLSKHFDRHRLFGAPMIRIGLLSIGLVLLITAFLRGWETMISVV